MIGSGRQLVWGVGLVLAMVVTSGVSGQTPSKAAKARIAFVSGRDGNVEIYAINADGSEERNLTQHRAFDSSPVWSPDGTKIAFVSDRDGNTDIHVMNADGSRPHRLTRSAGSDVEPVWAPVGIS